MREDNSWAHAAAQYERLYARAESTLAAFDLATEDSREQPRRWRIHS